jgi:hypothetical protein
MRESLASLSSVHCTSTPDNHYLEGLHNYTYIDRCTDPALELGLFTAIDIPKGSIVAALTEPATIHDTLRTKQWDRCSHQTLDSLILDPTSETWFYDRQFNKKWKLHHPPWYYINHSKGKYNLAPKIEYNNIIWRANKRIPQGTMLTFKYMTREANLGFTPVGADPQKNISSKEPSSGKISTHPAIPYICIFAAIAL